MILLDIHIWVWWVHNDPRLPTAHREVIRVAEASGIGVSIISCWEVAKLASLGRLNLGRPVVDWLAAAPNYPGFRLLDLTPAIAVESTQLPGTFHRDPADQMIVATARIHDCPLVTLDARILAYPHAKLAPQHRRAISRVSTAEGVGYRAPCPHGVQ